MVNLLSANDASIISKSRRLEQKSKLLKPFMEEISAAARNGKSNIVKSYSDGEMLLNWNDLFELFEVLKSLGYEVEELYDEEFCKTTFKISWEDTEAPAAAAPSLQNDAAGLEVGQGFEVLINSSVLDLLFDSSRNHSDE